MRDRVFGIETEYAVVYAPGPGDTDPPSKLALYRMFEPHMARTVPSLPRAFSPLRFKWGRFLANGSSFHYEADAQNFEQGLIEMASPECRDPLRLLACEHAKDRLIEQLAAAVNSDLRGLGYRGEIRIGKNNLDSEGHTFGSHENYWVDDTLPLRRKLLLAPCFALIWASAVPVLLWFALAILLLAAASFVIPLALLLMLAVAALVRTLPGASRPAQLVRGLATAVRDRVLGGLSDTQSGEAGERWVRRLSWIERPLHWLARLHGVVYRRFHFQKLERDLTAFLVTRMIYAGAGSVCLDGGPLFRLAQRPRFLRQISGIFTSGDARPLFETRDLFFRPWSAFGARRRLHLLLGDANLCDWAMVLRVGATALVLEAIESDPDADWPQLADPLGALRDLDGDPTLDADLVLADGTRSHALAIQQRYLDRVRQLVVAGSEPTATWKLRVLRMWQETLDLLGSDVEALEDRIDWIAKLALLLREVPDADDRESLVERSPAVLRDPPRDAEQARLRDLAYRALRLDLRYHELGPRGLHRRLRLAQRIRVLVEPERVTEALQDPPPDTRAHGRGLAIREARSRGQEGSADWHRVRVGRLDWRWFPDPLSPVARRFLRGG